MPGRFTAMTRHTPEAQAPAGLLVSIRQLSARLGSEFIDLVFPPRCLGCGRVDTTWCNRCQQRLETTPLQLYTREVFDSLRTAASGEHTDILQSAVQALKYAHAQQVAAALGTRLAVVLAQVSWPVDMLVPVPLHADRLRMRGYNQAGLIAEALASQTGLPLVPDALRRERATRSQVGLSRAERLTNMVDAFHAEPSQVTGQRVVIVDDVLTTGATLLACAQVMQAAGALSVYGLTVTTAQPP